MKSIATFDTVNVEMNDWTQKNKFNSQTLAHQVQTRNHSFD